MAQAESYKTFAISNIRIYILAEEIRFFVLIDGFISLLHLRVYILISKIMKSRFLFP